MVARANLDMLVKIWDVGFYTLDAEFCRWPGLGLGWLPVSRAGVRHFSGSLGSVSNIYYLREDEVIFASFFVGMRNSL